MDLVGLPDTMGIVLATAVLTNMYTAFAVFLSLPLSAPLSVAEVSVLGGMMLLAHSLPVEGAIAKTVGLPWKAVLGLRLGGALVFGMILNLSYKYTGTMQMQSVILWRPEIAGNRIQDWIFAQLETLFGLLLILCALVSLLRLIKFLGIERWIHVLLAPFLKLLGLKKEAANVTVIGVLLGLSFCGGLLIQESRTGNISKKDIIISMLFISICHSLIDDTIIVLLLGGDMIGIFWARILFALMLIGIIVRLPVVARRIQNIR
jgi:hypothetical protein